MAQLPQVFAKCESDAANPEIAERKAGRYTAAEKDRPVEAEADARRGRPITIPCWNAFSGSEP